MNKLRRILALLPVIVLVSCHESGTWVDDASNFERAWGIRPPAGVVVVHSWYYRSAHFTREEIYYFELRGPETLAKEFAAENRLEESEPAGISRVRFIEPKPQWFAPKPLSAYRIWQSATSAPSCYLLVDRHTDEVFIHCAQL